MTEGVRRRGDDATVSSLFQLGRSHMTPFVILDQRSWSRIQRFCFRRKKKQTPLDPRGFAARMTTGGPYAIALPFHGEGNRLLRLPPPGCGGLGGVGAFVGFEFLAFVAERVGVGAGDAGAEQEDLRGVV